MDVLEMKKFLLSSPSVHYWLKNAIKNVDKHDIIDMANDVDILKQYINKILQEVK